MLGSAFGSALAAIAFRFLEWYLQRKAIRDVERQKITIDALIQIANALDWKAAHPVVANPDDPFADFLQRKSDSAAPKADDPGSTGTPRRNPDGSS
jgi:hypothetical protein